MAFIKFYICSNIKVLAVFSNGRKKNQDSQSYGDAEMLKCVSEAVTGGVLEENVFLEILLNSQENTCARVSFKKETLARVFSCGFCEISKNTFFTELLLATASGIYKITLNPCQRKWLCINITDYFLSLSNTY